MNLEIAATRETNGNWHSAENFREQERSLKVAREITESVVNYLKGSVSKIILFGSRARGDFSEDSDYDFVVIGEFENPSIPARMSEIKMAINRFYIDIDLLAFTQKEFETKFLFKSSVEREGLILYERAN